jgi:hypothetical protein
MANTKKKNYSRQFFVANIKPFNYKCFMSKKDLTKENLYEGVKAIIESPENHIHLNQQKLYTLFSIAFNYFLFESERNPGHYIIRVEDNYLLEKLARKSKDLASRKLLNKLNLPRKLKYGNSMFHLDFFSFTTWANTNELPKEKIKGALVIKNAHKSPLAGDTPEDPEVQAILEAMPKDYYIQSLLAFVPKTITIAFEEEIENLHPLKFDFIKEEPSQKVMSGVSIAADINIDDLDD